MCLPGTGFVLRNALAKFCPGPLKRLANAICTLSVTRAHDVDGGEAGDDSEAEEESAADQLSVMVSAAADLEDADAIEWELEATQEEEILGAIILLGIHSERLFELLAPLGDPNCRLPQPACRSPNACRGPAIGGVRAKVTTAIS